MATSRTQYLGMTMGFFGWFGGSDSKSSQSKAASQVAVKPDFRAAEVIPGNDGACFAARELAGKRFLTRQVPKIPLRDCNYPNCHCTYRRHRDRRLLNRRASDCGGEVTSARLRPADDRRSSPRPGRRASDRSG